VPQGLAVFNAHPIIRRLMDPKGTMAHWSDFERGGHFPAMEVPDLLVDDLRAFFAGYRWASSMTRPWISPASG